MAVNSSSSVTFWFHCVNAAYRSDLINVFLFIHVFVLVPLSIALLCQGQQRWRQQRSFATTSHTDIFTYNSAAMELIYGFAVVLSFCGRYAGLVDVITAAFYGASNIFSGQISFHILTCVERYLAVVHPVIYLGLRQSRGVRIRNISVVSAWLLYCGWMVIAACYFPKFPYIPFFCLLTFSIVVVSFCSLSVLYVLIHSQPREMNKNKKQVGQSKRRAFYTITAITGVLWLSFLGLLVTFAVDSSQLLNYNDGCFVLTLGYFFTLPSSFVLPVLFLYRAPKPICCLHSHD